MVSRPKGPRYDKANGVWAVFHHDAEGKPKRRTFREREEAQAFKNGLLGQEAARSAAVVAGEEVPAYDGSASWWDARHGELGREVLTALRARDDTQLERTSAAARTFASLANSAKQYVDTRAVEQKIRELQARYDALTAARRDGTKAVVEGAGGDRRGVESRPAAH